MAGLAPVELAPKDGLSLINASAVSVGHGALVVADALAAFAQQQQAGALTMEGYRRQPHHPRCAPAGRAAGRRTGAGGAAVARIARRRHGRADDTAGSAVDPLHAVDPRRAARGDRACARRRRDRAQQRRRQSAGACRRQCRDVDRQFPHGSPGARLRDARPCHRAGRRGECRALHPAHRRRPQRPAEISVAGRRRVGRLRAAAEDRHRDPRRDPPQGQSGDARLPAGLGRRRGSCRRRRRWRSPSAPR